MSKWDKFDSIDHMSDKERKEFLDEFGHLEKPTPPSEEQLEKWANEPAKDYSEMSAYDDDKAYWERQWVDYQASQINEIPENPDIPEYRKPKLARSSRFQFAEDAIGDIVGAHHYGIPFLFTRREIQVLFRLSKRSAQRFVKDYLIPMGAVIQIGSKYLIQPWGVYRLLHPNGRCSYCGRGGEGECEMLPKYSISSRSDTKRLEKYKASKRKGPERKAKAA